MENSIQYKLLQWLISMYQLSLIDPRDGTVLQTELDDRCDKLVDERRSS